MPKPGCARLWRLFVPWIAEISDPAKRASSKATGDKMGGRMRTGRVDHVDRILPQHLPPCRHRPRPPPGPAIGNRKDGGVTASDCQMFLDINEPGSDDAHFRRNLVFEFGIGHVVGVSVKRQHGNAPSKSSKIARILQRPKDPAAATLRGIVVRYEESVAQGGSVMRTT